MLFSAKKVVVTRKNNVKKVRLKCSTSNYGSKPTGNKKNDRISQTPSRNTKNKVEAQPRNVNKKNRLVEPIRNVDVKQSQLNANSELICDTCKKSMFDGVHDMCLLNFVKNVNSRAKSAKKHKKQNIWKPTSHVFTEVGFKWKPTGRTFTIVGFPDCSLVSGLRMFKTHDKEPLSRIIGYGDYHLGNVTISRVYYIEGLGHNLFSVEMDRITCFNLCLMNTLILQRLLSPVPVDVAPRAVDLADSSVSTSIEQDASSISIPSTQDQENSPIISQGFEESPKIPYFHDDPLLESLHEDSTP
nr:integrase, catalytic region, zinc finger, CCHC-type, peptidase aspartic, catalytic [Tanacetum cinerariifolium]